MLRSLFCLVSFYLAPFGAAALSADNLPLPPPTSLYDITSETINGAKVPLSGYKGRVLLIVNIETSGPLAKQLAALQSLYSDLSGDGLSIMAYPSNDFITGSPMTIDGIKSTCFSTYQLTFPVFALTHVTGSYKDPVYQFLSNNRTNPIYGGDVSWSFVKFLISRDGTCIGRFGSTTSPEDQKVKDAIQKALKG